MKSASPETTLHVYTRVSTVAQEDKGTSLASQEELGRRRADQLGFDVRVWNEGGRSSNHNDVAHRPELYKLVTEMKRGTIKHLFVYDASRLSRNDEVSSLIRALCIRHQIKLYTKDGTYDFANPMDTLVRQVLDGIAQFDNASRAERTRVGKLVRAKQNRWHGGPPVFGYRIEDKKLVLDPVEAAQVREIFERYASGVSTATIKAYLDRTGVSPRRGGIWTKGSILKILSNTHYLGYYTYSDKALNETVRVECPPIVTASLGQAVQERRKVILQRKGQTNRTKHFYLLRDLMYCGDCGSPMGARTRPSKHEHFYYCPQKERQSAKGDAPEHKFSKKTGCSFKRSMNIEQADELVWEAAVKVHAQAKFQRMVSERLGVADSAAADLKATQKAIKTKERELKRADEALTELDVDRRLDRVSSAQYTAIAKGLTQERNVVAARLEVLKQEADQVHERRRWGEWVTEWGKEAPKRKLTPEERKQYLSGLIDRIDVWFKADTKEHVMEIKFVRAIAGGASFTLGSKHWRMPGTESMVLQASGVTPAKRLTPVGKYSVTVE